MVLFSFITPQFESGAQSEVTMLSPDSSSSCLPPRRCSRNLPLSGQAFPLTVCTLIGTRVGRRARGKPTMQFKDKQQNKTGTASPTVQGSFCVSAWACFMHSQRPPRMWGCKATPRPGCRPQPAAPGCAWPFISPRGGNPPPAPAPPDRKEWAKSAIIIGHYSNKGVSLFKLVHENCTLSKSHEPEKC